MLTGTINQQFWAYAFLMFTHLDINGISIKLFIYIHDSIHLLICIRKLQLCIVNLVTTWCSFHSWIATAKTLTLTKIQVGKSIWTRKLSAIISTTINLLVTDNPFDWLLKHESIITIIQDKVHNILHITVSVQQLSSWRLLNKSTLGIRYEGKAHYRPKTGAHIT